MRKLMLRFLLFASTVLVQTQPLFAQCSICTKTAQQLGQGPASALNTGILYLMFAPLAIMAFIGFRWWKNEQKNSVKN
jgi:hypothetical protein